MDAYKIAQDIPLHHSAQRNVHVQSAHNFRFVEARGWPNVTRDAEYLESRVSGYLEGPPDTSTAARISL